MYVCMCAKSLQSCPTLCDLIDGRPPGPLSLGFSRQENWSGWPCPPPMDLPNPGIKPTVSYVSCIGKWVFTTEPPGGLNVLNWNC